VTEKQCQDPIRPRGHTGLARSGFNEGGPGSRSRLSIKIALRALSHRNFQLFFAGQFISLIGTWMQSIAQSWLIYRLTGSSLMLGSVGFAGQFPVFLLSPIGGSAADRCNRHRIIILTQCASMMLACVLAALTLSAQVQVWHIFTLSALLGATNAFDIPARQAFLVDMVGKEDLMNAIALNSSMFNGARIVGPAVAGIMVASIGEGWCFFCNGISYVAVIAGLLLMKVKPGVSPDARGFPHSGILEGFRYVRQAIFVRALLLLLGLVSLVAMPYAVLMPIFADQILHGGPRGLGVLMGAAGVGALMGALSLTMRSETRGLNRWVGYSCVLLGISLLLFALSDSFWLSVSFLMPVGFAMMVQTGSSNTLIQTMVPDRLRGRVMGVYSMMFMGMAPVGAFLAGTLAHRFGAPAAVSIGALGCIVGGVFFLWQLPVLGAAAAHGSEPQTKGSKDAFPKGEGVSSNRLNLMR
jgi:MFS family permease